MRRTLAVVLAGLAMAAAWIWKPEWTERRHRPIVRRAVVEPVPPIRSTAAVRTGAESVRDTERTLPDRRRRFPVRVEGMVIDEETGRLLDDARVRVEGGTGYCQHGDGLPRAGGGFEMSLTGGPGVEVQLGVYRYGYFGEFVRVRLEEEWIVLSPVKLRWRSGDERVVMIQGSCVDERTGGRIDGVNVAVQPIGTADSFWHKTEAHGDGVFGAVLPAEPGLVGDVMLCAPGYQSVVLRGIGLQGRVVELPVVAMEPDATPLP